MDDFEGRTFPTKKGGTLTVLSWNGDRRGSHKYYPVVCSICSTDFEMFPLPFLCKKSDIIKGVIPCGCGSYNYKGDQQKLILNRVFRENDLPLTCIGWEGGIFKNSSSRPLIFCNLHKTTYAKSRIAHLRTGQVKGCNYCAEESRRDITCTPLEDAMKEVNKHLDSIDGKFIEFTEKYKGLSTPVRWQCVNGHKPITVLESLIKTRNNCGICKTNGFRKNLRGYFYITLFVSEYGCSGFYKVGVSNKDPKIRNKRQEILSKGYTSNPIAYIEFELGEDALLLEKDFIDRYADGRTPKASFSDGYTETFIGDDFTRADLWGDLILITGCSIFGKYEQELLHQEDEHHLPFKGKFWLVDTETLERTEEDIWQ